MMLTFTLVHFLALQFVHLSLFCKIRLKKCTITVQYFELNMRFDDMIIEMLHQTTMINYHCYDNVI